MLSLAAANADAHEQATSTADAGLMGVGDDRSVRPPFASHLDDMGIKSVHLHVTFCVLHHRSNNLRNRATSDVEMTWSLRTRTYSWLDRSSNA